MINFDKIYIASDHAGFEIKQKIIEHFEAQKVAYADLGPKDDDRVDYPDYANQVCQKLKDDGNSLGLLICGSGQGMAMRANKFSHIRAALCWTSESAMLARQHNDANVLCVGSRLLDEATVFSIIDVFFNEKFEGGRHQKRVTKIQDPTS